MNPFGFFSFVFSYPTEETIKVIAACAQTGRPSCGRRCADALCNVDLEELQAEYTRLFINAYPTLLCPPYESFYREGTVYGTTAGVVRDFYKDHGFDYVYEGEPPDLLSVELDFLAMTDDGAFRERLKEWVFDFTERVKKNSEVYGVCAGELEKLLTAEVMPV